MRKSHEDNLKRMLVALKHGRLVAIRGESKIFHALRHDLVRCRQIDWALLVALAARAFPGLLRHQLREQGRTTLRHERPVPAGDPDVLLSEFDLYPRAAPRRHPSRFVECLVLLRRFLTRQPAIGNCRRSDMTHDFDVCTARSRSPAAEFARFTRSQCLRCPPESLQ